MHTAPSAIASDKHRVAPAPGSRLLLALAALVLLGGIAAAAQPVSINAQASFNIAPQKLASALVEFSRQANTPIVSSTREVDRYDTAGVTGVMTLKEALKALLAGTDLETKITESGAIAIGTFTDQAAAPASPRPARAGLQVRLAQASGPQVTQTEERGDSADKRDEAKDKVQEIIVTATKRAEKIEDVPQSIAVVSAADIDKRALVSAGDYLRGIPGVNQVDDAFNQSIIIRGIETSPQFQNFDAGTTVATYFGETPTTNTAGIGNSTAVDIKLVDIERVEVLRGPQGTSFGNSSLGGAVRTIPVAPRLDRVEGKVAASHSFTAGAGSDNSMVQAIGNFPLIQDKLALRAAVYRFEDSGFYRGVAGSDPATQAAVTAFGARDFAIDSGEIGAQRFNGGRVSLLYQPTSALKFTVTYLKQVTEIDGTPGATLPGYDQTILQVAPEHVRRGQHGGLADTNIEIVNPVIEYDLDWGTLTATYSNTESGSRYITSYSFFPGFYPHFPLSNLADSKHQENVGELRLATKLGGPLDGVAGLYYEHLKDSANPGNDLIWHGDPAANPFSPGLRSLGIDAQWRDLKQKAAFAEVSWKIVPRLTLTGGARYYDYERSNLDVRSGFLFGGASSTLRDSEANGTSLRGNLSFKPDENSLVYAGWAEGFRLGIPQTGLPPGLCDVNPPDGIVDGSNGVTIESTRETKSDTVESVEVGGKTALFDRRLMVTGAVFRIDWKGMPVRIASPAAPAGCGLAYTANVGEARSEGVEFQLSTRLGRAWTVDGGASWIRAELAQDAPSLNATEGTRLPGSPSFNANFGAEYGFEIGGYNAFVRADAIYVGEFYGNLTRSPDTRSGDYVKVDLSARVSVKSFDVDVFVRNLTDADDYTFRGIYDGGGPFGWRMRPRTIGVQLGYHF